MESRTTELESVESFVKNPEQQFLLAIEARRRVASHLMRLIIIS